MKVVEIQAGEIQETGRIFLKSDIWEIRHIEQGPQHGQILCRLYFSKISFGKSFLG